MADAVSLCLVQFVDVLGALILGARLGIGFGRRRIIFTGLAIFTAAAAVARQPRR